MKKAASGLVGFAALVVVVAGCSGGSDAKPAASDTENGKKVVAALTPGLARPAQGISTEDGRCAAKRFVDAVGVERLVEAKVVSSDFRYSQGAAEKSALAPELTAAQNFCVEERVAAGMAPLITSSGGLIGTAEQAGCVARGFAHGVGLNRLIAGQAVDTKLAYVPNGALQNPANARAYGDALASCLGEDPSRTALKDVVEKGYTSAGAAVAGPYAACFLPVFVNQVGVGALFANRFVTDTGEYAYEGRVYDTPTATALAGAILGCVDTVKADASAAAQGSPGIDAAALEACAKRTITTEFLRDKFLVNQLLGKVEEASRASQTSERAFQGCLGAQK